MMSNNLHILCRQNIFKEIFNFSKKKVRTNPLGMTAYNHQWVKVKGSDPILLEVRSSVKNPFRRTSLEEVLEAADLTVIRGGSKGGVMIRGGLWADGGISHLLASLWLALIKDRSLTQHAYTGASFKKIAPLCRCVSWSTRFMSNS